ncbi:hypothetical protein ACLMJK_007289 [Lecanora helva]
MSLSLLKQEGEGAVKTSVDSAREEPAEGKYSKSWKSTGSDSYLDVPLQDPLRRNSDTISEVSAHSLDNNGYERGSGGLLSVPMGNRSSSNSPAPARIPRPKTWKGKMKVSWTNNKGLALVILAQFFGTLMNVVIRILEVDGSHGPKLHPFQILFARMTGTVILSGIYMFLANVEHAPFGSRKVRGLLVARGIGGFFGVFGMYYSLQYLPMSDATVITFLAPIVACWACSFLINEPFTRSEQVAGVISFLGVILIARPSSFFPSHSSSSLAGSGTADGLPSTNSTQSAHDMHGSAKVTSAQRLSAVGVSLIGVLGAACAYTTIRWIGKRAHPLISVTYFAAWSDIVSIIALLALPNIGFQLPAGLLQWTYLLFLGICGFVMQFLLTAGLQYEKSSRATNMVYTQMLFALAFDKLVWDTTPGVMSILGSGLILGSALYVAVLKNKTEGREETGGNGEEEVRLVAEDGSPDDDAREGRQPLRGVQEVQLRTLRV